MWNDDKQRNVELHSIALSLAQLVKVLQRAYPGPAAKIYISIGGRHMNSKASAPFQLADNQQVPYLITAVDADGNPAELAAGASIAVASSDVTIATVVPDATPAAGSIASGMVVGQSVLGTAQINVAVTNADGSAGPTGAAQVQVVAGAAASIQVTFGTPVSQ